MRRPRVRRPRCPRQWGKETPSVLRGENFPGFCVRVRAEPGAPSGSGGHELLWRDLHLRVWPPLSHSFQLLDSTPALATHRQAFLNSQALTNFKNPPTRRPFEAGFRKGQICDDGDCAAGTDVPLCEEELSYECGGSYDTSKLLDSCGGHAKPYHYHTDLTCNYNSSDSSKHSPLIGIALDGHGIYGLHEGTAAAPVLDACGGHYGNVSGDFSENGELGEHCAYHYHTTTSAPFTVGCFGPVSSLDECRALFPDTCGDGEVSITTANGTIQYDLFCPCYQHSTEVPDSCPGAPAPAPAPTIDACLEGVGACLDYIKDARTQGGDSAAFGGFGGTLLALVALVMAALAALQ